MIVPNVDRRGQHGLRLQDLEDVQVPTANGRRKGEGECFGLKMSEFPFQAKVILGFTASVGLEEMSIELIHEKFLAKLQLTVRYFIITIIRYVIIRYVIIRYVIIAIISEICYHYNWS